MRVIRKGLGKTLCVSFAFLIIILTSEPVRGEETAPSRLEGDHDPETTSETLSDPEGGVGDTESDNPYVEETATVTGAETILTSSGASDVLEGESAWTPSGPGVDTSLPLLDKSVVTGAATVRIPIIVPPGRGGISPDLALTYNSHRENGWVGVGWDLELGAIQRSTKRGVDYTANDFVFVRDGYSIELVPRDDWGADYYGTKIEEMFSKVYFNSSTGGWEVTGKDGTTSYYGTTSETRQESEKGVFKWCLDAVEDTNGNYMTASYTKDQGEIYLERVEYTGSGTLSPSNAVVFHLENREDAPPMFETSALVVTAKRLRKIEVYGNGQLSRTYELRYDESSSTFRSLLSAVSQYGSDGVTALPEIALEWQEGENVWTTMDNGVLQGLWRGYQYSNAYPMVVGDFNGDGRTDVGRVHDGGVSFYVSDGIGGWRPIGGINGNFGPVHGFTDAKTYPMVVGDFNGDGKTDVGRVHRTGVSFYVSDGIGGWRLIGGINGNFSPSQAYTDTNTYPMVVGDFNGDGKTDVGRVHRTGVSFYVSDGSGGWKPMGGISGNFGPSQGYTDANTYPMVVGDFNGDGRTDVGRVSGTGVVFFVADGAGGWIQINSITGNLGPAQGYTNANTYPMMVGDFNGDGKTDVGRVSAAGVVFFLSEGGDGWTRINSITGNLSPAQGYTDANIHPIFMGDFNGDGKTDVGRFGGYTVQFYISDGREGWKQIGGLTLPQRYVPPRCKPRKSHDDPPECNPPLDFSATYPTVVGDWNGDGRTNVGGGFLHFGSSYGFTFYRIASPVPDLLISVSNGMGGTATVEYTPSSYYENTLLPFVVHTVSSVTEDDGLGNPSTRSFTYSGGYFDAETREFRGFEYVSQTNPDGTTEETWFHQDEYVKGRPYEIEVREPNMGPLLSRTTLIWDEVLLNPPEDTCAFVKLTQKRTEFYDNTTVYTQEDHTYDDTSGNLLSTLSSGTDGESVTTTNQYENFGDWLWRLTQETLEGSTSGKVRETYYEYEPGTGNLLSAESWLHGGTNPKIEMTYDDHGNPATKTDARGFTTRTEYDAETHTYPVKVTHPETGGVIHTEEYVYDHRFGKVTASRDENGNWTDYAYDTFGRPVQVDFPDGGQVLTEYYDEVFPRYVVTRAKESEESTIDRYDYVDGLGRKIQTITFGEGQKSIVAKVFYDEMGRQYRTEGAFFSTGVGYPKAPPSAYPWKQTTFDFRGRPIQVTSPDSEHLEITATFTYSGFSQTITDPDERQKTEEKDFLGRIIEVTEHGDHGDLHTLYEYNAADDLLSVTDHDQNTTTMSYDTLGRKTRMNDPDMGHWVYTYDQNGNLLTQTDAKGETTTFAYDALNRITWKRFSTSDPTVTYTYDNLSIPNGRGRLYSVTNGNVTTTYNGYDEMGRVEGETKTIVGDQIPYTTQYDHDLSGKRIRMTYPDGYEVYYQYHPGSGLLQSVVGSDSEAYATVAEYEPTGKIGQVGHGNGTETRYAYDPWSTRLLEIITSDSSGAPENDIQNRIYQYTPAGDIREIRDELKGITYSYTYDKLHRLIAETNTGPYSSLGYEYDAIGNITLKAVGATPMRYTYHPLHKHAVKRISLNGVEYQYTYDSNGNLLGGPDFSDLGQVGWRAITYNAENIPTQIERTEGGRTVRTDLVYDGDGVRAKKAVQGGATTYYIGEHFELTDGIEMTRYVFAGDMRVAKTTGVFQNTVQVLRTWNSGTSGTATGGCYISQAQAAEKGGDFEAIYYFHKDHLGSSTALTNADGLKVESAEYLPFGHQRDHTGTVVTNYKYTDQELDPETGLYNYKARLYDPVIGRFISPDTIVPDPYDSQALNRYSYCLNNPLIYIDPSGYAPGPGGGLPEGWSIDPPNPTTPGADHIGSHPWFAQQCHNLKRSTKATEDKLFRILFWEGIEETAFGVGSAIMLAFSGPFEFTLMAAIEAGTEGLGLAWGLGSGPAKIIGALTRNPDAITIPSSIFEAGMLAAEDDSTKEDLALCESAYNALELAPVLKDPPTNVPDLIKAGWSVMRASQKIQSEYNRRRETMVQTGSPRAKKTEKRRSGAGASF